MNVEATEPAGYSITMGFLNQADAWDVPGLISDIAGNVRRGLFDDGQVVAVLEWMHARLKEARPILVSADSELSAVAHGRPVDKEESKRISTDARKLCKVLKGF